MSRDLFNDPAIRRPRTAPRVYQPGEIAASLTRAKNGDSSTLVPMDPAMQGLMDRIWAEEDAERARKDAEMDTPENRQKAAEAEAAERKRKKFNFHCARAIPRFMDEGWKQIKADFVDEEIRVYTNSNDHRRFWGIKPAGMAMDDFWEQNDPEVSRYYDKIAETWVNALVPPPVTAVPVIWAGRGPNPDLPPTEPPTPKSTPKRARGRPATKAKVDVQDTIISTRKRPRGRPLAKIKPAVDENDVKRPRGRPPTKAKPVETSIKKGKKTSAVKGKARIAKPSQKRMRPSAPSTHKMRTRGEGPAELLQL